MNRIITLFILYIITLNVVIGYKVEEQSEVHQYISNESQKICSFLPIEIKEHIKNPLTTDLEEISFFGYNKNDDLIDGSGEDDSVIYIMKHMIKLNLRLKNE